MEIRQGNASYYEQINSEVHPVIELDLWMRCCDILQEHISRREEYPAGLHQKPEGPSARLS